MHAGSKRSWAQARRRGGGSGSEEDWRDGADDDEEEEAAPQTDFAAWSVAQLRAFLEARGAEHELCGEHADLVRRTHASRSLNARFPAPSCLRSRTRRATQVALAREVESTSGRAGAPGGGAAAEEEEADPLDAFMAGVSAECAALPAAAARGAGAARAVAAAEEEYDPVASFMEARTRGGGATAAAPLASRGGGYNSDEEVYATAAALDATAGGAAAEDAAEGARGDAAPLAAVDHDAIEYEDFEKDFYRAAPEVARLSAAEAAAACAALGLQCGGREAPAPVQRFGQCGALPAAALLLLK
jgi:hypothetical protein